MATEKKMQDKKYSKSLFIFRRDLRLADNTGLIRACIESTSVVPMFIITKNQVINNKLRSFNAIQFMIDSLYDLDFQIKKINPKRSLLVIVDDEIEAIKKVCDTIKIDSIYVNIDYTPYSKKRDILIKKYCNENGKNYIPSTDILLLDNFDSIKANNGNRYHVFSQFYKNSIKKKIRSINKFNSFEFSPIPQSLATNNIKKAHEYLIKKKCYVYNDNLAYSGGRTKALEIIKKDLPVVIKNYPVDRDYPSIKTSGLSAHNKFGTISVREAYVAFSKDRTGSLTKQLYWRDFYYYCSVYFKTFYKYQYITIENSDLSKKWPGSMVMLKLWKEGKTGFPIVDAGMRQMNSTGFMHNRSRMIVAEFLTKDLLIDWKYGERYFTTKLVDIDRAQNTGNWNWSSSFGLDSSQFLRIFNPWTQSSKYDHDAVYIKKWVPELADVPPNHIHNWFKYSDLYPNIDYPKPIVDHDVQRKIFIKFYKDYVRT